MNTGLENVIALCKRPDSGIEKLNAEDAESGAFDTIVLAGWLHSLATSTDCEKTMMREDVRKAARQALIEILPLFRLQAPSDETALPLLRAVNRMFEG